VGWRPPQYAKAMGERADQSLEISQRRLNRQGRSARRNEGCRSRHRKSGGSNQGAHQRPVCGPDAVTSSNPDARFTVECDPQHRCGEQCGFVGEGGERVHIDVRPASLLRRQVTLVASWSSPTFIQAEGACDHGSQSSAASNVDNLFTIAGRSIQAGRGLQAVDKGRVEGKGGS